MTVSHAVRCARLKAPGVGGCAVRTPGFAVERFSGLDEPEEAQAVDVLDELERHGVTLGQALLTGGFGGLFSPCTGQRSAQAKGSGPTSYHGHHQPPSPDASPRFSSANA